MTSAELQLICAALGFTATVMREGGQGEDDAERALGLAKLIEEFCRANLTCALETDPGERDIELIAEMADALDLCLQCDGRLTWSAEHDAQIILDRAKLRIEGDRHDAARTVHA